MAFDLHISIPEESHVVRVVQQIASSEHITAEEATTRLMTEGANLHGKKTPAEEILGAFSSDADSAITDEAMSFVRALRQNDRLRDFGV